MLYREFIEGTGCRDNEHNYKVYRDLEIMYMNSDLSKAEIYEYGKKLVDNSKSEEELRIEAKVKAEIGELKEKIAQYRDFIEDDNRYAKFYRERGYKVDEKRYKNSARYFREQIKEANNRIAVLKWVLA